MKTKVILSQQMASAIIAAGQEEAQKNNWSVSDVYKRQAQRGTDIRKAGE